MLLHREGSRKELLKKGNTSLGPNGTKQSHKQISRESVLEADGRANGKEERLNGFSIFKEQCICGTVTEG